MLLGLRAFGDSVSLSESFKWYVVRGCKDWGMRTYISDKGSNVRAAGLTAGCRKRTYAGFIVKRHTYTSSFNNLLWGLNSLQKLLHQAKPSERLWADSGESKALIGYPCSSWRVWVTQWLSLSLLSGMTLENLWAKVIKANWSNEGQTPEVSSSIMCNFW